MPAIWTQDVTVSRLNAMNAGTLAERLGIRFTELGDDYLKATMPVDHRTHQPLGMLHGGASVALAETLGSVGAYLCADPATQVCVGLEINANHIRAVRSGLVTGMARPLHRGRTTQVWDVRIVDAQDRLVCVSRITIAVLDQR
ncbi:esterase [Rhodothermaceae bacterium RA]|nr:esterase [Rhodothermaceae bacterium RA]